MQEAIAQHRQSEASGPEDFSGGVDVGPRFNARGGIIDDGVRQRNTQFGGKGPVAPKQDQFGKPTSPARAQNDQQIGDYYQKMQQLKGSGVSNRITAILEFAGPIFATCCKYLMKLQPVVIRLMVLGQKGYTLVKPYWNMHYTNICCGLLLVFYGSVFPFLIATVEAFRLTGYESIVEAINDLWTNFKKAKHALTNDEQTLAYLDKDGDGTIDAMELFQGLGRSVTLRTGGEGKETKDREAGFAIMKTLLKSTDPQNISKAIGGLWKGWLAVMAILRSQFAANMALGINIGKVMNKSFKVWFKAPIEKLAPPDWKPWVEFGIDTFCKFVGVSIAIWITTFTAAFHSAIRGSDFFTAGFFYLIGPGEKGGPRTLKFTKEVIKDGSLIETAVQYGLAFIGLYSQLVLSWSLPFILRLPFDILMTPVYILESFLATYAVWGY